MQRTRAGVWSRVAGAALVLTVASMLDVVHLEGDHTSYLVLAPHPTLGFVHGGGEEGAFLRTFPGAREPWWLSGDYLVVLELTDG